MYEGIQIGLEIHRGGVITHRHLVELEMRHELPGVFPKPWDEKIEVK